MVSAKSTSSKLRISLKGEKVAFVNATLPRHEVDYSHKTTIKLGTLVVDIPKTKNKNEFIQEINRSNIISCTDTGVWEIAPV